MTAVAATRRGREAAEALMVDTVTFTDDDGSTTFDPTTGQYVTTAGTVLYTGRCQVQVAAPNPRDITVGDQEIVAEQVIVKVPVSAPAIPLGSVGVITAVADISDPSLVGRRYRVTGSHAKTYATARRLPCELITT